MSVQIIVGGRFDYIKLTYESLRYSPSLIYFDNDSVLSYSSNLFNKLRFAIQLRIYNRSEYHKLKARWREYFNIDRLENNDNILFLIYEMNLMSTDIKSIREIKQYFPNSRFVLFFTNTIGSVRVNETKYILENRDAFDLIYSFNRSDAERYNFLHMNGGLFPYSPSYISKDVSYSSDVFFCGKDKGRLQYLNSFAENLMANGIKCKFFVTSDSAEYNDDYSSGSLIEKCKKTDGLVVLNKGLPYQEVLKYIGNTNCLFEYSTSAAPTIRYSEAIAYEKKLISNARDIKFDELYRPSQFLVYDEISLREIIDFINSPLHESERVNSSTISAENFIKELITKLF